MVLLSIAFLFYIYLYTISMLTYVLSITFSFHTYTADQKGGRGKYLSRKALHVVGLPLQGAFGDEQGKVAFLYPHGLDAGTKPVADALLPHVHGIRAKDVAPCMPIRAILTHWTRLSSCTSGNTSGMVAKHNMIFNPRSMRL